MHPRLTAALLAGATAFSAADTGVFYSVDPSTTFQHTCEDPAGLPLVIDLDAEGYAPGDTIRVTAVGDFAYVPAGPEEGTGAIAVFSSDGVVDPDRSLEDRVQGAIQSDAPDFPTGAPLRCPGETTEIPEDFMCDGVDVTVPDRGDGRAAFLIVSAFDEFYSDNEDGPDTGPFGVRLGTFCGQVLNPGAESGTLGGWQADESEATSGFSGLIAAVTSQPQGGSPSVVLPAEGDRFFSFATQPAQSSGPATGLELRMIQGGCVPQPAAHVSFSVMLQTGDAPDDRGMIEIVFFDASGTSIARIETDWVASPEIWRPIKFVSEVPTEAVSWELILSGRLDAGRYVNTYWDSVQLDYFAACTPADLAAPFGLLDLADVNAFTTGFVAMDPIADLNTDGLFDLSDINLFATAFTAGCP